LLALPGRALTHKHTHARTRLSRPQLDSAEEFVNDAFAGNLGEVLIRCNNVLYVRKLEGSGAVPLTA